MSTTNFFPNNFNIILLDKILTFGAANEQIMSTFFVISSLASSVYAKNPLI